VGAGPAGAATAPGTAVYPPEGTPRTHLPGFYFHAAAAATEERRRALEPVVAMRDAAEEGAAAGEAPPKEKESTVGRCMLPPG